MVDNIFFQISILLGITVSIAFIMRLLRQPLLIAYLVAGIVAGPMFLNMLESGGQAFDAFAEFGVVLLLFVVGLSLHIEHIRKIGRVALIAGIAQVIFTASIGSILLRFLQFEWKAAIFIAIALTFSSTIIIVKLLSDKKDAETVYGRYVMGLMIVQDIIAIVVMMVVTSLGSGGSLMVSFGSLIAKLFILVGFVIVMARFIVPIFLGSVARSGEFLFIFTIAWCFGIASLLYWLGFSLEIGAIVAGITLGSSAFQSEIISRIKPLRDFFIVIFFIILGTEISLTHVSEIFGIGMILSVFILFGNSFILYRIFRLLKFTRRNSFLAGVTAAQVSEFGFVLLVVAQKMGYIYGLELEIFTIVALTTIVISSYVITYNEQIYRALVPVFDMCGKDTYNQKEDHQEKYHAWVFGYHRIGWKVCEALRKKNISFAVVDYNPETIMKLKHRGIPAYFGDAADVEFLDSLPLSGAQMIISTIPEFDDQKTLFQNIRRHNKKAIIIGNLFHNTYLDDLYEAGANYIMMPHLLGGQWVSEVITDKTWSFKTFELLRKEQREEMKLRFSSGVHTL
ncbi:MAG: cation:proton antiporter [Candidatus Magasanikbacteria bacterium]|nr:cation:proton antiporter [Candidatus Magasanikbacteria bacterium]